MLPFTDCDLAKQIGFLNDFACNKEVFTMLYIIKHQQDFDLLKMILVTWYSCDAHRQHLQENSARNELILVAVTSNSLAQRSWFGESTFVLTQANYRKLQRTVKRNWSKRIFLTSNLQIPIYFLLPLLVSHVNEMLLLCPQLTTWNLKRSYCSFFILKNNLIKKRRRQYPMALLMNLLLFSFKMRKYANHVLVPITDAVDGGCSSK